MNRDTEGNPMGLNLSVGTLLKPIMDQYLVPVRPVDSHPVFRARVAASPKGYSRAIFEAYFSPIAQ